MNNIEEQLIKYKPFFKDALDWAKIFENLSHFDRYRSEILAGDRENWLKFILNISYIESTIPTYDYYTTGKDEHLVPFTRSFKLFGRARLEEEAVEKSCLGERLGLKPNPALNSTEKTFHMGAGDPIPDLVDNYGYTYDVKHKSKDFSKAHGADFILCYHDSGDIELCSRQLYNEKKFYVVDAVQHKSIKQLCEERGINYLLFNPNVKEIMRQHYLGLID